VVSAGDRRIGGLIAKGGRDRRRQRPILTQAAQSKKPSVSEVRGFGRADLRFAALWVAVALATSMAREKAPSRLSA